MTMFRTVAVALAIVALTAGPALARGRAWSGAPHAAAAPHHVERGHERFGGEHHRHFRHAPFFAVAPDPFWWDAPYVASPPSCVWQEGHWVNQVYADRYGGTTTVPTWVPGQWLCG